MRKQAGKRLVVVAGFQDSSPQSALPPGIHVLVFSPPTLCQGQSL